MPATRFARLTTHIVLAFALLALTAGCSQDPSVEQATPTPPAPATTPPTEGMPIGGQDQPPTPGTVDGSPAPLEDGRHAAYLHALDVAGRSVTVDVVQFLTGREAIDAYREDHPDDPEGPPNDYYIANENPRLRTLPVADGVTVRIIREGADLSPSSWEELAGHLGGPQPGDPRLSANPYWIAVADGQVTAIEEQFIP